MTDTVAPTALSDPAASSEPAASSAAAVAQPPPRPALAERECDGGFQSTSLQRAARHGDASLVAVALECTATNLDAVDADGRTALLIAALNGHASVVRALLDAGCDMDARDGGGATALDAAKAAGHKEVALMLQAEQVKRDAVWGAILGEKRAKPDLPPELTAMMMASAAAGGGGRSLEAPF